MTQSMVLSFGAAALPTGFALLFGDASTGTIGAAQPDQLWSLILKFAGGSTLAAAMGSGLYWMQLQFKESLKKTEEANAAIVEAKDEHIKALAEINKELRERTKELEDRLIASGK